MRTARSPLPSQQYGELGHASFSKVLPRLPCETRPTQAYSYSSMRELNENQVRVLYKACIYPYGFYELMTRVLAYLFPGDATGRSAAVHSFAAASAGGIATLLTHPFDVIKTKIQVRPEARYSGLWSTTTSIWAVSIFISPFFGLLDVTRI
jgi:hypothetical protein